MFNFFTRKSLLDTLKDTKLDYSKRLTALEPLAKMPFHADILATVRRLAEDDPNETLRRDARNSLGKMGPAGNFALLDIAIAKAAKGTIPAYKGMFSELDQIMSSFGAVYRFAKPESEEAQRRMATLGETILRWPRDTHDQRYAIEQGLKHVSVKLDLWGAEGARAHSKRLQALDQNLRAVGLARYLHTALTISDFGQAKAAVSEIAQLDTPEASAALRTIRSAPPRVLEHVYDVLNDDVTEAASYIAVRQNRSTAELGDELKGDARRRWEEAK